MANNIECVFLGVPKACCVPERGLQGCVGSVAALKNDIGQRNDYILCARIDHERWLCHPGTLADGTLDEENPFSQEGLIEKDIRREAFSNNCAPRRRVGPRTSGAQLRAAARKRPESWNAAVAHATWIAENKRATLFDFATACGGYEPNPFKWEVLEGRLSHTQVTFAWTWVQSGEVRRELVQERADNLTVCGQKVPRPPSLRDIDDEHLRSTLEQKAEGNAKITFCAQGSTMNDGCAIQEHSPMGLWTRRTPSVKNA